MGEVKLAKATRLQLGHVKSPYGQLQTAAGNAEKWGMFQKTYRYPYGAGFAYACFVYYHIRIVYTYLFYRDAVTYSEHITYEDLKDRCLTPMPGWTRLRTFRMCQFNKIMVERDPTPLEFLPFELKVGQIKHASI